MNFFKKFFFFVMATAIVTPVFADYNSFDIPDSAEIRRKLPREWFESPLDMVRDFPYRIETNYVGTKFQVRYEEREDDFVLVVAPGTSKKFSVYNENGLQNTVEDVYPAEKAGSWILARKKKTGEAIYIRYYFAQDSDVYVQFHPNKTYKGKNATFADMMIFNSYAAKNVPIGIPFERFYTMSFAEIQELTKKTLPWNYVVPSFEMYARQDAENKKAQEENAQANFRVIKKSVNPARIYDNTIVMIDTIKERLDDIVIVDDAIYDEYGKPVTLEKGEPRVIAEENKGKISVCSLGFLKWVVDGIVEPLAGSYLKRGPLLQETISVSPTTYQGIVAENYRVNSALDWTRNLAAAVLSVTSRRVIPYKNSGVDVTIEPFSSIMTEKGLFNTAGYIQNSGYRIFYLKQLLYVLAATNPEYFYLAAIRQTDDKLSVETKVFNDGAVIFPYFDIMGAFKVVVFYKGVEYSLERFCNFCTKNMGNDVFVHLTRVKTTAKYYPQEPR